MLNGIFTSESVSEGHPDKVADQISDSLLDYWLEADPEARVACETLIKTGLVMVAGEVSCQRQSNTDVVAIIRRVLCDIGYDSEAVGFDGRACGVLSLIDQQSEDIARGVDQSEASQQGAGDQGLMFGYACRETDTLMPAPVEFAHRLMRRQAELRRSGKLPWLRPDAKSQVTVRYEEGKPKAVEAIVLSTQHAPDISTEDLREAVREEIIKPVFAEADMPIAAKATYHINPTGRFVRGGPLADCGLTGRKIIVDTYGGMARHGGGAFSGKDPSKVDRSAAYAARYAAKNIVAAGLADRCELQLSYAIGEAEPVAIHVETYGTEKKSPEKIMQAVRQCFDLTPAGIIDMLKLKKPIYRKTAAYGHFGRSDEDFSWERTDRCDAVSAVCD